MAWCAAATQCCLCSQWLHPLVHRKFDKYKTCDGSVQADDAALEAGANPKVAAAAAEALRCGAAAATAAQRAGAIPESKALWSAGGAAGADAAGSDSDIVSSADGSSGDKGSPADDDLPSIDSGSDDGAALSVDGEGGNHAAEAADEARVDAGAAASASEDEGGYGAGGLSWEAVMAQMLAQQARCACPVHRVAVARVRKCGALAAVLRVRECHGRLMAHALGTCVPAPLAALSARLLAMPAQRCAA